MVVLDQGGCKQTLMSIVLPGDHVPARHANLKLGPGLQQLSTAANQTDIPVIATRAGVLHHSANRSKWWVESNSRRVRPEFS
jgi:exosome complex component RRP40